MKKRKLAVFILAVATMVSSMPVQAASSSEVFNPAAAAENEDSERSIVEEKEAEKGVSENKDAENETVEGEVSETVTDETETSVATISEEDLEAQELEGVLEVGESFTVDKIVYRVTSIDPGIEVEAYATDSLIPLKTVTIPSVVKYNNVIYAVTSIPSGGFSDAFLATKIVISEGVRTVDEMAFPKLDKVKEISLPGTLKTFTTMGFPNLETITVPEWSDYFKVEDGVLFTKDGSKLWLYPSGDARTSYTVPEGTEVIGEGSFYQNKHLSTLTLADTVTEIEPYAFYEVQALISMTYTENISSVGEYNLYKCPELKEVTLCNSGTLGANVLSGSSVSECPKLETIIIDGNLSGWVGFTFYNLPSLKAYEVRNSSHYRSVDGVLFRENQLLRYPAAKEDTTYVVPEDTTKIAALAFNHMKNTTEVILNPGVYLTVMAFQYPNTNAPIDVYFRDKETVHLDSSNSGVFVGLNDGSHIYLPTDEALASFNSFPNAINSEEGVTVFVEKKEIPTGEILTGITNGKTYCSTVEVTISEQYIGNVTVMLNGEEISVTDGKFVISPAEYAQTVVVTTKSGSSVSYTVTVNEGHSWGKPEWVWSADKTTASLSFTCQNDSSHVERPEVSMSKKETPATCTAEGSIVYTAKADFEAKEYTYVNTIAIPKKNHSMTHHAAVNTTDTNAGNVEYWFCSECGMNFDSAEGGHVLTDVVIPVKRNDTASTIENHETPATGDSINMLLWGVLLIFAGSGLTGMVLYRKKKS